MPATGASLIETYNFDKLVQQGCYALTGHSKWFDVKFRVDGTIYARGSPCGNHDDTETSFWESHKFLKNANRVREMNLRELGSCLEYVMPSERRIYLYQKIRPFVALGVKAYHLHAERGVVTYRLFTCPSGDTDDIVTRDEQEETLSTERNSIILTKSAVTKMKTMLICYNP